MLSKEEIGLKIKKAREFYSEKIGIPFTQADLAKKIGATRGYINDLEAGRSYPSLEKLQAIVEACDINLGFFDSIQLNEIPEQLSKLGIKYLSVTQELKERGLTPEEIRKLAEIADMFKNK